MAGLYDNISNLQNEKSLTFLYRAPKIFLEPLSIPAMTTSYRTVFGLPPKEAASMRGSQKDIHLHFRYLDILNGK